MKRKNKKYTSLVTVAAFAMSTFLLVGCNKDTYYSVPGLNMTEANKYALNQYDYENLDDTVVTVRADTVKVTKRNVERPVPEVLSDEYSVVYDSVNHTVTPYYSNVTSSTTSPSAYIKFGDYGYPGHNVHFNIVEGSMNTAASEGAISNILDAQYTDHQRKTFYKYMLMSQGMHLAKEASYLSSKGLLTQDWLKKHPVADKTYGAVLGTNNAVEKEIMLDPLYRSPHFTGLYMPAGELVTVKVEGLQPGEYLNVVTGMSDSMAYVGGYDNNKYQEIVQGANVSCNSSAHEYFTKADVLVANGKIDNVTVQSQFFNRTQSRAPWMHSSFKLNQNGEFQVGWAFGGAMHIEMGNTYSRAKVTITGAVETPHYIMGQTTPEYFDEYLRDAPGVIGVVDVEIGQLIGPMYEMGSNRTLRRVKTEEIDKLAMLWHSFLTVNESYTGGQYNRFNKVMFDEHVPAGAAVSLGNYSFAQPAGWFDGVTNYRGLINSGNWGTLHEIGHNHARAYGNVWGFGDGKESEVRNNALTLLAYLQMLDVGTNVRNGGFAEHGEYADPYKTLTETLNNKWNGSFTDFSGLDYFPTLGMYANIMHSFGPDKFYEVLSTYETKSHYIESASNSDSGAVATEKKRADFAYRCALVNKMNFIKFFNENYKAKITETYFTPEQLKFMNKLPNYEVVTNKYAGEIDGIKASGDYNVSFGEDITFDLLNTTISTMDKSPTEKGFKIIGVDKPTHGSIKNVGNGKYRYTFNKKYFGNFDKITFRVKLDDGICHKLSITLRISYNSNKISAYDNITEPVKNIDELLATVEGKKPDYTYSQTFPGVNTYQSPSGQKELRISEFYWKSPVSGDVTVSAKWDDWGRLYFGENFDSLETIVEGTKYISQFSPNGKTVSLQKDKYYAVKLVNFNTGGGGSATFGYKTSEEGANFVQPSGKEVFHPKFDRSQKIVDYVYEPTFLVSKKDNIRLSVVGTDKSEWSIVQAPDNDDIHGGRYETTVQKDPTTGEVIEGTEVTIDKWTYLIDGSEGTMLHTKWQGNPTPITPETPKTFIIDTSKKQSFNFFKCTTRNSADAYITDWDLFISDTVDGEYRKIASGDRTAYVQNNLTISFKETQGRYLKFVVKGTVSGKYAVIGEFDSGIKTNIQQIVPPSSEALFATKGWTNSSQLENVPSGYLFSKKKNSKLVFKFTGDTVALFAAKGYDFGSIKVKIDGKTIQNVSLNIPRPTEEKATRDASSSFATEDIVAARQLVFMKEGLKNKEHTMEVITTSNKPVLINVFGISYTGQVNLASNIYKERALTGALVFFLLLALIFIAFCLCLFLIPKFREKVFNNKVVNKMNDNIAKSQAKAKEKRAEKKKAKDEAVEEKEEDEIQSDVKVKTVNKKLAETKVEKTPAPEKKAPSKKKPAETSEPASTPKKTTSSTTTSTKKKSDSSKK